MRHMLHIFVTFFGLLYAAVSDARTWYVKPDSTGDAPTIQAAMNSAQPGDEVLLAPGTYSWTTQGTGGSSVDQSMVEMRPGVSLRGEAGAESTILDAEYRVRVILCLDVGYVRIEGLTITRGSITSYWNGGGISSLGNSRPTISNCVVRNNRVALVAHGGGIACRDAGATILNCQILDNLGYLSSGTPGIYVWGASVSGCLIRGNSVFSDGRGTGSGIYAVSSTITDCWIEANFAGDLNGGSGGGATISETSVIRCTFVGNTAEGALGPARGGGVFCFSGRCQITECVFLGNEATGGSPGYGAAIASSGFAETTVMGCTMVGNTASGEGIGGIAFLDANIVSNSVTNTIVAFNEGAACFGSAMFTCVDIFGNSLGDALCGHGGRNFSLDPHFCSEAPVASRNVALQPDSPCLPGQQPHGAISCGLIGARSVGCGTVSAERRTWGEIKQMYRR